MYTAGISGRLAKMKARFVGLMEAMMSEKMLFCPSCGSLSRPRGEDEKIRCPLCELEFTLEEALEQEREQRSKRTWKYVRRVAIGSVLLVSAGAFGLEGLERCHQRWVADPEPEVMPVYGLSGDFGN